MRLRKGKPDATRKVFFTEEEADYLSSKVDYDRSGLKRSVVEYYVKRPNKITFLGVDENKKQNLQILIGHLKEKNGK